MLWRMWFIILKMAGSSCSLPMASIPLSNISLIASATESSVNTAAYPLVRNYDPDSTVMMPPRNCMPRRNSVLVVAEAVPAPVVWRPVVIRARRSPSLSCVSLVKCVPALPRLVVSEDDLAARTCVRGKHLVTLHEPTDRA